MQQVSGRPKNSKTCLMVISMPYHTSMAPQTEGIKMCSEITENYPLLAEASSKHSELKHRERKQVKYNTVGYHDPKPWLCHSLLITLFFAMKHCMCFDKCCLWCSSQWNEAAASTAPTLLETILWNTIIPLVFSQGASPSIWDYKCLN